MDQIYDVTVMGAGPGGGKAAMGCAGKGLSTVILEKKSVVDIPSLKVAHILLWHQVVLF